MRAVLALVIGLMSGAALAADFRLLAGHGGPVQDVAVSADGLTALTASFDNSVGLWSLTGEDVVFLESHAAAVKTVAFAGAGRAVSGGDDYDLYLWDLKSGLAKLMDGHQAQIKSVAVSPDAELVASASWDRTIGLWDATTGENLGFLQGHDGPVNDVAFSPDGARLYSAASDGTIRIWDVAARAEDRVLTSHGFATTTVVAGEGWLAYGAVDGGTRVIDPESGAVLADLTLERRPILAMAVSPDGGELSVADGEGFVMSVATGRWKISGDYKAAANGPVWALAYTADGESLVSGGLDDAAFVWPVDNVLAAPIMSLETRGFNADPSAMSNGERQFQRKCSICHSLTEDGPRRAGPTLAGLFGRPAGSLPGYSYSDTVANLDIEWNDETIDALFDQGPDHYIPGSKMPMQVITRPEDRRDLIEYLKDNT